MKEYDFVINGNKYKANINNVDNTSADVEVNGVSYHVEKESVVQKEVVKPSSNSAPAPLCTPVTTTVKPVHVSAPKGAIKAPLPGVILSIYVKVGDMVQVGQKLVVLEAMKMENCINSDREGKVIEINVEQGDSVSEDATLIVVE